MTYVTAEPISDAIDRTCVQESPVDCIYEGARMLCIHPDECMACLDCEACPVEGIYCEDDLPAQWAQDASNNADFFTHTSVGSPDGAALVRPAGFDHPSVAGLGSPAGHPVPSPHPAEGA